jgi:hypothetical protein
VTLTLVLILVGFFVAYRFWPDLCAHIVNTGLAEERREVTPVEKLRAAVSAPPPDPNAAQAAAAAALVNAAMAAKK